MWSEQFGGGAAPCDDGFTDAFFLTAQDRGGGVGVADDSPGAEGVWPFFMLRLRDEATRDAALRELWTGALGVSRLFIHALPDYAYLQPFVGEHDVPNARAFAAGTLTVSNSPWLDDAAFEIICTTLEQTLS